MTPRWSASPCEPTRRSSTRSPRAQRCSIEANGGNDKRPGDDPAFLSSEVDRSALRDRRDLDFDSAVLRAAGFSRVGSDRLRRAEADGRNAALVDALAAEIIGDGQRAALRQILVMLQAAGRVRMTVDVDE